MASSGSWKLWPSPIGGPTSNTGSFASVRGGLGLARGAPAAETRAAAAAVAQAGIPVLVVTGGWSSARDMEGDLIAKLTHGRHVIVRSPSHFVQAANPVEFNKVALDFMREADKTRSGQ